MDRPDALGGLNPADLLKQGAAADTIFERSPSFTPPTMEELAQIFPQFEVLEMIGQGGMGAVYKVRQKALDRVAALKILPPAIGEQSGFSQSFTREAKALAKLNHPGIVTLYEFGREEDLYYFLMEYVDGMNLRQLLQKERISPREAMAIVPQICDALQYAHDHGIVHRDIKPENLLLDRRGKVKVADFGIAKVIAAGGDAATAVFSPAQASDFTIAGKVVGTPDYMAPEQIDNPGEVDHRADIYALGVVFYQMLTGELPGKQIEMPSQKIHLDVRLDEVVLRALEKSPARRYQQADLFKTQVETIAKFPVKRTPGKSFFSLHFWVAIPIAAVALAFYNPWGAEGWYGFAAVCGLLPLFQRIKQEREIQAWSRVLLAGLVFMLVGAAIFLGFNRILKPEVLKSTPSQIVEQQPQVIPTPEQVDEPPQLRFLTDEEMAINPKTFWHPDGSPVMTKEELALLDDLTVYPSLSKRPDHRNLTFWISHGFFDAGSRLETYVLDSQGKPIPQEEGPTAGSSKQGLDGQRWNMVTWLVPTDQPFSLKARYTIGPMEKVKRFVMEPNVIRSLGLEGKGRVANTGQDLRGNAFITLLIDPLALHDESYNVEAVKKDGKKVNQVGEYGSGSPNREEIYLRTIAFDCPLGDISHFNVGIRKYRTFVWKNVTFPGKGSSTPATTQAKINEWLGVIDAGNYGASWDEAAASFKKNITRENWENALRVSRQPLGQVESRKFLTKIEYADNKAPQEKLSMMTFNSEYEKKICKETVTFVLDKDGVWRAAGYLIQPVQTKGALLIELFSSGDILMDGENHTLDSLKKKLMEFRQDEPEKAFFLRSNGICPADFMEKVMTVFAEAGIQNISIIERSEGGSSATVFQRAEQWLQTIDQENYDGSWDQAAEHFRALLTREAWKSAMEAARKPLGKMESRQLEKEQEAFSLPGGPEGDYLIMSFKTKFEHLNAATETVTFYKEKDGIWRASGYYVSPINASYTNAILITTFGTVKSGENLWTVQVSKKDGKLDISRQFKSLGTGISPSGWTAKQGWFVFIEDEDHVWAYDGEMNLLMFEVTPNGSTLFGIDKIKRALPEAVSSNLPGKVLKKIGADLGKTDSQAPSDN